MDKLDILQLKFIESLKAANYSPRSIRLYGNCAKPFLGFLRELGITNIAEVDRRIIQDYQTRVYLSTYKGKPLAPSTQKGRLTYVRVFFQYLLKTGQVLYDPTGSITMPKQPSELPRGILSKKEIGRLLAVPNLETPLGIRDRAIMELLYATGIRASELCSLTLYDIDLNEGELRVNQGKGGKDRVIPLGEVACDYLEIYLNEARPKLAPTGSNQLFLSRNGRKLDYSYLGYLVRKYSRKARLEKRTTPHALRHTCATHLLKGKADIRQIQKILGHSSLLTTQRYTKVEIGDLKRVIKKCHPRERKEIETHEA
jgi:integrase/recombinase XerD